MVFGRRVTLTRIVVDTGCYLRVGHYVIAVGSSFWHGLVFLWGNHQDNNGPFRTKSCLGHVQTATRPNSIVQFKRSLVGCFICTFELFKVHIVYGRIEKKLRVSVLAVYILAEDLLCVSKLKYSRYQMITDWYLIEILQELTRLSCIMD